MAIIYRAVVKRAFLCRLTATHFRVGTAYTSEDLERIKQLQAGGFLATEIEEEAPSSGNEQVPDDGASLVPGGTEGDREEEGQKELDDSVTPAMTDNDPDDIDERLQHVGGGYYLLPNGEKVRGKEKAAEALEALDAAAAAQSEE